MKRCLQCWSLSLLLCTAGAHAQLYKWVGPDGKVSYSDTPPPSSAKQVETKSVSVGAVDGADLPYELAEAVKGNPVTLYTTDNCAACDSGRKLLNARGIPFTEKTVKSNDDIAQLKQVTDGDQLPFLMVGRRKQSGFESNAWNNLLTIANYPASSKLPKTYSNPPAKSAAPRTVTNKQEKPANNENNPAATPRSEALPPATGNAPPGFRF